MKSTQSNLASIRFGQRVNLALRVQLRVHGRSPVHGVIRNASVSGALIETALDLPLHTNLVVTLALPGDPGSASRDLTARVVRDDPDGVGVEWRDMATVDITDLFARASNQASNDG